MTKKEFMIRLQRALNNNMGSKEAIPHVEYYQEYIEIEVRKGRSPEEILEELGEPELIARSITDVERSRKTGKAEGRAFWNKARRWFEEL